MNTDNPFDDLLNKQLNGPMTPDQAAAIAKSQGYQVIGNQVVGSTAGGLKGSVPTWMSLSDFTQSVSQKGPSFLDQTADLVKWQYEQSQGAADRQFGRNNQQIDATQKLLDTAPNRFNQATSDSLAPINGQIGTLNDFGKAQAGAFDKAFGDLNTTAQKTYDKTIGGLDGLIGGVDKSVNSGIIDMNTAAARAEGAATSAITNYNKGVNEDVIQSTVQGIRADVNQQMKMLQNGIAPDGRRLSPAEQADAIRQLKFDTGRQVSSVAATVRQQAQTTLAGLRTNLANVILEGGKMKAAGAELGLKGTEVKAGLEGQKAAAGAALTSEKETALSGLLQSQEGQRALQGMVNGLNQFKSQLTNANALASLNFEMAGRNNIADMVKNNPETVFGLLTAWMAMGGIATAPGGRNIPALKV